MYIANAIVLLLTEFFKCLGNYSFFPWMYLEFFG